MCLAYKFKTKCSVNVNYVLTMSNNLHITKNNKNKK